MFYLQKKLKYNMDIKTADKMLQNVFSACDTTPNRVSFDKIVLRSRQNLFSDNLLIILACVIFALTFLTPLFFPHSNAFVSVDSSKGRELTVNSSEMTESTFSISFDGAPLDSGSSYMLGDDNTMVLPMEYDRETNTIVFPYVPMEYNIYVYDVNGKCIHLLLSPHI